MKKIRIKEQIRPFSHRLGEKCLIPRTNVAVQVFPTRLIVGEQTIAMDRMDKCTTILDLERGRVGIFGKGVKIYLEREGDELILKNGGKRTVVQTLDTWKQPAVENLSLGKSKKLDWELVCRRGNLQEILPAWYRLSQMIPLRGNSSLVCDLEKLFRAGFSHLLFPTGKDLFFQGLFDEEFTPSQVLHGGADLIRSMFFQDPFIFLPKLPRAFPCGRMTGVRNSNGDEIDFVWSKHLLRSVIIRPARNRQVQFGLQKAIRSFRMRRSYEERGEVIPVNKPIDLRKESVIYLDRFQK